MQKFRLSFCLACLLWLGVATVGKGQNIASTVGQISTYITAINTGTITDNTIHLKSDVVYTLTSPLPNLTTNFVIDGHGATIKIDPASSPSLDKIFFVSVSNATLTVQNLHMVGKSNTGSATSQAIYAFDSNLIVKGCEIENFSGTTGGGAITVGVSGTASTLTVEHCYIHDNYLYGIGCTQGTMGFTIKNSTFANHTTFVSSPLTEGSAIYFSYGLDTGSATHTIENCTFFNNRRQVYFSLALHTLNINHCTIYGGINSVSIGGSGIIANIQNSILTSYSGTSAVVTSGGTANTSTSILTPPSTSLAGLSPTLTNKGGFAPVLPITSSSCPAVNATSSMSGTDQRNAQFNGNRDKGAYEFEGAFGVPSPQFSVSNTNPFGLGSLYQAIVNANNQPAGATAPTIVFTSLGPDDIGYQNVPPTPPYYRIQPVETSSWSTLIKDGHLPTITRSDVTINGGDASIENTNVITSANDAKLRIELKGANAGATANGLEVSGANCTIKNLNINSFNGIGIRLLSGGTGAVVQGCFIGTDITGNTDLGNTADGISVEGASNVLIGGILPAHQNIISGNNGYGIGVANAIKVNIQGNTIGLNALKDAPIANGAVGVAYLNSNASTDADRSFIGGTSAGAMNIIAGNASNGIWLATSSRINVYNNYVGIKGNGTPQQNGSEGIRIQGTSSNINIGAIGAGNVVGGNSTDNIVLFESSGVAPHDINIMGNHLGIGADGITSLGGGRGVELLGVLTKNIFISQNIIACNVVKGISLVTSANESVTFPVITEALTTRVSGTANAGANVEIYVDNSTCSTGSKQGNVYLGTTTADATGAWTFTTNLSPMQGQHITAIQHAGTNNKNTSEFSTSKTVNYLPTTGTSTNTKTTLEDTQIVFAPADFSTAYVYNDTDSDTFAGIKIVGVSGSGTLYLDGNTDGVVDAGEAITGTPNFVVASIDILNLKFKPADNASGSPYASFYFEVFDGKEYSQIANAPKMDIVVTPVNDLPTSADINIGINAPLVLEDTDFALIKELFTFTDAEDAVLSRLQIVTLPTKGTLLFDGSAVTANQIIPASDLPLLKYKSALNENGASYTTFTFKVIDSQDGASDLAHTATIHVTAVNDEPTINVITSPQPDISANSNPVKLKLTGIGVGGGSDEATQTPAVTATSDKPIIAPTISATMDTLTYRVLQEVTTPTTVTITVTVQDNGGTDNGGFNTITTQFTVTVVPNMPSPYNLSTSIASSSSILLTWEDDNTNVVSYEVYRAITTETNPFQMIGTSTSKSYTDNAGLVLGTYYIYKVRSVSPIGFSNYSNLGAVELVDVSASPTNLQASVQANVYDEIDLTWTDNSNDEEGFRLERKSVYTNSLFEEIAILPANTTAYTDTELLPNVKYTYRLRSFNDNGQPSAYSNVAVIFTNIDPQISAPLPPFDLEAVSVSTRQINLNWEYSINPDVVYWVSRSTDGVNFDELNDEGFIIASLSSVKSYIDTIGLVQGTLYYYKVRASTGGGLSAYSNVDTARAICNLQDLAIVRIDNGKEVICEGKSAVMSVVSEVAGATYQWKRNGVIIPNAKFDTFYASQTGVYTCTISVGGCIPTTSINSLFVAVLNEPEALTVFEQNGELLASINDADSYQWYFDYRPVTGATSRNYTPTNAGVYYVVATVENCISTSNTYFYAVLGSENVNISQYIHLAPNPAHLQTEVRFALPTMGDYAMEVLDTKGKAWLQTAGKKTDVELRETISLAKVPAGVYLIKLRIGNQQGYKKLVVSE